MQPDPEWERTEARSSASVEPDDQDTVGGRALLRVGQTIEQGVTVVALTGEADYSTRATLHRALEQALSQASAAVVVDLSGLSFCDLGTLTILVLEHREALCSGRDGLVLTGLSELVGRVWGIAFADALLAGPVPSRYPSPAAAVAALATRLASKQLEDPGGDPATGPAARTTTGIVRRDRGAFAGVRRDARVCGALANLILNRRLTAAIVVIRAFLNPGSRGQRGLPARVGRVHATHRGAALRARRLAATGQDPRPSLAALLTRIGPRVAVGTMPRPTSTIVGRLPGSLADGERTVLALTYLGGYTLTEVATLTGLPRAAVGRYAAAGLGALAADARHRQG